jgi:hypothetical protein
MTPVSDSSITNKIDPDAGTVIRSDNKTAADKRDKPMFLSLLTV